MCNIYTVIIRHVGEDYNYLDVITSMLTGEIGMLICLTWQKRHTVFVIGFTHWRCMNVKNSAKALWDEFSELWDEFSEMRNLDYNQSESGRGNFGCTNCQRTFSSKRGLALATRSCGVKIAPRSDENNDTVIIDPDPHLNKVIETELYLWKKWKMLMKKSCIWGTRLYFQQ